MHPHVHMTIGMFPGRPKSKKNNGWMDGQMDGWMAVWMDGLMDGWMDG